MHSNDEYTSIVKQWTADADEYGDHQDVFAKLTPADSANMQKYQHLLSLAQNGDGGMFQNNHKTNRVDEGSFQAIKFAIGGTKTKPMVKHEGSVEEMMKKVWGVMAETEKMGYNNRRGVDAVGEEEKGSEEDDDFHIEMPPN